VVTPVPPSLDRRAAVAALLEDRGDLLVVTGLGSPSYDVHAAGDSDANYYLWGAMGSAALVGLGLAQARPDHMVLVITGDGEQLMGLGGLATIGVARPGNLAIAVIDNERFGETGMQESHTGYGVDLANVALACGFVAARTIHDMGGVKQARASSS
jgi:thiamine pyrophosphate-dependent acetolactate synthase large subunit-like protein